MSRTTDQDYLRNEQYRDAGNLNARAQLHIRFGSNDQDWHEWVFDRLTLPAGAQILELGCGPGWFWQANLDRLPPDWQITLSDFSPGMVGQAQENLATAPDRFRFAQLDAQAIPFDSASLDGVIANHMLYHLPDRQRAYAEIRRVLKPGGRLYAATNGRRHMQALWAAVARFAPQILTERRGFESFSLENGGAELEAWFAEVAVHSYPNNLLVTEAAPLVAYVRSARLLDESQLAGFAELAAARIQAQGYFEITPVVGLFAARIAQSG